MNFIKRSITSAVRNLGKTAILFLVVLVLGVVLSGAISVSQAVQNANASLRGDLPPVAIVEADMDALQVHEALTGQWPDDMLALSPQILEEVGDLPYVRSFDYSIETILLSDDLKRYKPEGETLTDMGMRDTLAQHNLKGVRSAEIFEIEEGIVELVSGRTFTDEEASTLSYVVLISQNFARANSLHIGSIFTLQNIVWDMRGMEEIDPNAYADESIFAQRSYDFEVIGIFNPVIEFDTGDQWLDADFANHIENYIYVPNTVTIAVMQYQFDQMAKMYPEETVWQEDFWQAVWIQNIYALYDSNDMDNFARAAEDVIPNFYTVTYISDSFSNVVASIESLGALSEGILGLAIGASIFILSLLTILFVRDRKQEIGILLALGERRSMIVSQIVFEVIIIALIAVCISLFIGNFISSGISETMLRNNLVAGQIADTGMTFSTLDFMGFSNNIPIEEVMANYDASLNGVTVITFFAAVIGTVMAATIAPMLYILRLNPRKIMM